MPSDTDPRVGGISAAEADLTNQDADLAARERALHARLLALEDRRRVIRDREVALRARAIELAHKATDLGVPVYAEVQTAAQAQGPDAPLAEVAPTDREASLAARRVGIEKRRAALAAGETAAAKITERLQESEATLAHRETSVAALAREVIRQEREHLARREAQARAHAEEMRRAAEARAADEARRGAERRALETGSTLPELRAVPPPPPRPSGSERRVHRRVAVELDVTLSSEHNFFTGFAENISEGGLFIATHEYLEVGTDIDLTFRLPSRREVRTRARVQWIREYNPESEGVSPGMGVRFLDLAANDLQAVMEFLRQREPMFYE
jgi:uncharacterized protein (TIGR02266 family)